MNHHPPPRRSTRFPLLSKDKSVPAAEDDQPCNKSRPRLSRLITLGSNYRAEGFVACTAVVINVPSIRFRFPCARCWARKAPAEFSRRILPSWNGARHVLMGSLIILVSLLIISARGQEQNPLRLPANELISSLSSLYPHLVFPLPRAFAPAPSLFRAVAISAR